MYKRQIFKTKTQTKKHTPTKKRNAIIKEKRKQTGNAKVLSSRKPPRLVFLIQMQWAAEK